MFLNRVIGVMRLDVDTYEEIEADETATSQAALVVAIVAIVGGLLGGGIAAVFTDASFLGAFLRQLIVAFVSWFVWSFVTYFVGTSFFGGKSTTSEMLRVLGFAQAPSILSVIPVCGWFVGGIWTLACTFIAIRQGLDLDNTKALLTAIVAFIAVIIVYAVIGLILGAIGLTVGAVAGIF